MIIYFMAERFKLDSYRDLINVDNLDTDAHTRTGEPMKAKDVIAHWLNNFPNGSILITTETR